jgi:hypothetical protein
MKSKVLNKIKGFFPNKLGLGSHGPLKGRPGPRRTERND